MKTNTENAEHFDIQSTARNIGKKKEGKEYGQDLGIKSLAIGPLSSIGIKITESKPGSRSLG